MKFADGSGSISTFKTGDRVRVNLPSHPSLHGLVGTVVEVDILRGGDLVITFDSDKTEYVFHQSRLEVVK